MPPNNVMTLLSGSDPFRCQLDTVRRVPPRHFTTTGGVVGGVSCREPGCPVRVTGPHPHVPGVIPEPAGSTASIVFGDYPPGGGVLVPP